jgi:hypothetical protein
MNACFPMAEADPKAEGIITFSVNAPAVGLHEQRWCTRVECATNGTSLQCEITQLIARITGESRISMRMSYVSAGAVKDNTQRLNIHGDQDDYDAVVT